MQKLIFLLGLFSTTGCIHPSQTDLEYQVKILEKRIKIMELDIQYLLENECKENQEEVEKNLWQLDILDRIGS